MPLDAFAVGEDVSRSDKDDNTSALELLKNSFTNRLSQQWDGVKQLADHHVVLTADVAPAQGVINRGAQIAGELTADLLPTLAIGIASRYGVGKLFRNPEENMLLAHPTMGLSVAEGATTGFVSGTLLRPLSGADQMSNADFARLRMDYGLGTAISFAAMTATSALSSAAGDLISRPVSKILYNPLINGAISGIPGGYINAEVDSLSKTGQLTGNVHDIEKSILTTSLTGAAFGGITGTIGYIHEQNFTDFAQVRRGLYSDREAVGVLNDLHKNKQDFSAMARFIESNPQENSATLAKIVKAGGTKQALSAYGLYGLSKFDSMIKPDDEVFNKTVKLAMDGLSVDKLTDHIIEDQSYRKDWIINGIKHGASADQLEFGRLGGLEVAHRFFGEEEPETHKKLLDLFETGSSAHSVYLVHRELPELHEHLKNLLREATQDNDVMKLDYDNLSSRLILADRFGQDSKATSMLPELYKAGVSLPGLERAIFHTASGTGLVKQLIESGEKPKKLTEERINALGQLKTAFEHEPGVVSKILQFEGSSVNLSALVRFMNKSPGNRDILADYVNNAERASQVNVKRMYDATNVVLLRQHFSAPESMSRLQELQRDGLSAARLVDYLTENKDTRAPMIEYMLHRNDSLNRLNDQMKLSLFPDSVAFHLIEDANAAGVPISSIVGHLKDWQTGKPFSELLKQHVTENKPITSEAIDYLADKAGGRVLELSNGGTSLDVADVDVRQRLRDGGASYRASRLFAPKPDFDTPESLAGALSKAADKIISRVPEGGTIVLLGRDAWPLVPLLREQGRDVQYFLWSRIQSERNDSNTRKQWLKEVPPNSYVVDTGYGGTILNAIKHLDDSSTGWLIKANRPLKYRQLLWGGQSLQAVMALERLPKAIGRSETYSKSGSAVSRNKNRDEDEGEFTNGSRWAVEGKNRNLLRAMNLPEWDVWRFSSYVGLLPKDRLFLGRKDSIENHYDKVRAQREQSSRWTNFFTG